MPSALTDIERRILDFMVVYLRTNTYQPSIREIGERFGIKSTKTVSEHLQALAEKGYLERDPSRSRGVRILGVDLNAETVSIPCFRDLPREGVAGPASPQETVLTLDRKLVQGSKGSFFVRVRGEEVAALGLSDGDHLLVEPAGLDDIRDADLVAASVDGWSGFARVSLTPEGLSLEPGRPGFPSLKVEAGTPARIVGRVVSLFRRLEPTSPLPVGPLAH